jgi:hypothetical protein
MLIFAIIYLAVGAVLIYLNFTGTISSTIFAIGIAVLIVASLVFKFVSDFLMKKRNRALV